MSLIKCEECKSKVSTKAATCPTCGVPVVITNKKTGNKQKTGIGGIVLGVAGGIFLICVYSSLLQNEVGSDPYEVGSDPYKDNSKQIAWIEISKDAVRNKLKDGKSAQFKDVKFNKVSMANGNMPIVTGYVNSKNSFGGYGGYQRFVSAGQEDLTFLEEQVEDFEIVWRKFAVFP